MTQIANNLDTSIYDIQEIIEKRKLEVAELDAQISSTTRKISRLELDYGITKKDFEEYRKNKTTCRQNKTARVRTKRERSNHNFVSGK